MKLRNLLMMGAFLLAVGSSFAFKTGKGSMPWYSINLGTPSAPACFLEQTNSGCQTYYTGPQCSAYFSGVLKPIWEVPFPAGPGCVTPLRQYQ